MNDYTEYRIFDVPALLDRYAVQGFKNGHWHTIERWRLMSEARCHLAALKAAS